MKRSKREEAQKAGVRGMRRVLGVLDPMSAMWKGTEAGITERLFKLFVSNQLDQLRHRRRQQERIHSDLQALLKVTEDRLPNILMQAYDVGRRTTATALGEEIAEFTEYDRGSLTVLERNLKSRLEQSVESVGRRVDDVFRRLGIEAARDLVSGPKKNPTKFANELAHMGVTAFKDVSGRDWTLGRYAEVAMRSTATEAIAEATENAMKLHGLDIIDISKSDNPCDDCRPFNGKRFSLSGRSERFPGLNRKFPIHPFCEHFMFPAYASAEEQVGAGLELRWVG